MRFDYKKISLGFLKDLSPRTAEVLKRRFGLKNREKETLETIGKYYGLSRERIRQIEKSGFFQIEKKIEEQQPIFNYFKEVLNSFGGFKREKILLDFLVFSPAVFKVKGKTQNFKISKQAREKLKNNILFLLTINNDFQKIPDSSDLYSFWTIDKNIVVLIKKVISQTIIFLKKEKKPFKIDSLFNANSVRNFNGKNRRQIEKVFNGFNRRLNKNVFQSCLEVSREIQKNPVEEYGLKIWPTINPRGIKDRSYLVLKKKNVPLHFKEIAKLIEQLPFPYSKKIHLTTVHNELIKNKQFVLVGRGLYALGEWGYTPGVVKDVIVKVLRQAKKPLSKKEISKRVLRERFVKENTVFLSLSDKNYFLRDKQGMYRVREA